MNGHFCSGRYIFGKGKSSLKFQSGNLKPKIHHKCPHHKFDISCIARMLSCNRVIKLRSYSCTSSQVPNAALVPNAVSECILPSQGNLCHISILVSLALSFLILSQTLTSAGSVCLPMGRLS